jgi:GGDEF domain-containing protein
LQRDLSSRDGDLELLAGGSETEHGDGDDFTHAVRSCVEHLDCTLGALIIPDKNIFISCTADGRTDDAATDALNRTQRHLLAWSQVQKRTVALNKAPPAGSPIGALPYKILACPILRAAQHVLGILVLFKPTAEPDFDLRQIRIIELLARRISYVLQNAYDLPTGLLSRTAFEKRTLALLHQAESERALHCVAYGDIDRLHVLNENHGMHVGDEVISRIAEVIRTSLGSRMVAARISGDRFALFLPDCSLEAG